MARLRLSEPNGVLTRSAATEPVSPRTYQLLIEVAVPVTVRVGHFGTFEFPVGQYVYTGSAVRNLEARVKRHLAAEKRLRWHIDFLLAVPDVRVYEVRRFAEAECTVNERTKGEVVVAGFGASDCRHRCGSHLKRVR